MAALLPLWPTLVEAHEESTRSCSRPARLSAISELQDRKDPEIFARVPAVRYTLIGDDTERDPEIYAELRRQYPDRVEAIWIRRVNPDPERPRLPDQGDLEELLRAYR